MTVAKRSSLRVSIPARRNSSRHRWIKRFAGGLAAVAVVVITVATAIATAGRVMAVSHDAHSDPRSLVGLTRPSGGLTWFATPDQGMVTQSAVTANASSPETYGTPDSLFADSITTGSLGNAFSVFDPRRSGTTGRFERPARRDEARAMPLPRTRPQLAALTPPGDLGIAPDEDAPSPRTAIYDITAKAVYMPNGERLEAHSGFGAYMDDPKHVRLRMRGVTPPNTYKLTMRESLFHGVQALRMTPVGDGEMFGRTGILAHNYLLGPNGQSNGCVSLKDYPKFLAAFQRGEIDRIEVVERLSKPPAFYARRNFKSAANGL